MRGGRVAGDHLLRGDHLVRLDLLRERAGQAVVLEQLGVVRLVDPADRAPLVGRDAGHGGRLLDLRELLKCELAGLGLRRLDGRDVLAQLLRRKVIRLAGAHGHGAATRFYQEAARWGLMIQRAIARPAPLRVAQARIPTCLFAPFRSCAALRACRRAAGPR